MQGLERWTLALVLLAVAAAAHAQPVSYEAWDNGPATEADHFPIAVWLQDPRLAPRYKEAGINTYVGLWKGPTRQQLEMLRDAGMQVICDQNDVARSLLESHDPLLGIVVGWQQQDEPDNAQRKENGQGYGPPVPPAEVVARYQRMRSIDPTRPVFLNLGQGVAWEQWHGRGVRTGHLEDYPQYARGADIVSFDIYPVTHSKVQGELWYVAQGVERLRQWTDGRKPVWNCIEASRIHSEHQPTPEQIRSEVWMSIIHGSQGILYFVHEWNPKFSAKALLDSPDTLRGVTAINQQIHQLAPVINSPTIQGGAKVATSNDVPVAVMVKHRGGDIYVFAVAMRDEATHARITVDGIGGGATAQVIGEGREVDVDGGILADRFEPYQVHLYRIVRR